MGVDAEDVDGDGLPELFVTNFANEYNTLYQNFGKGDLLRQHGRSSAWRPTRCRGSAGAARWPTSTTTAGPTASSPTATSTTTASCSASRSITRSPRSCSATSKGKRFRLATRDAGPYFDTKHVGRGAAFGDLDNDGDIDIVVNHKDGAPALLRNDTKSDNHWVRFALQGTKSNRDAIGAKLEITTAEPAPPRGHRSPDGKETVTEVMNPNGRSTASARGAAASREPTTRGSWWASARRTGSRKS